MTDRLTNPIRKRLKTTSQQTKENLSDIWSRITIRLGELGTNFESLEQSQKAGQAKIDEIMPLFDSELTTREVAARALLELYHILQAGGEEMSQIKDSMKHLKGDMQAGENLAKKGKHSVANLQTVAQEGRRFTQDDPDTIVTMLDEVNKGKLTQALVECGGQTWQELSAAFEAAREARG